MFDSCFIAQRFRSSEQWLFVWSCAYLNNFTSSNAGLRALICGGKWNNGANCSLVYENGNNTPSNTNSNIGSRLWIDFIITQFNASTPLSRKR